MPPWGALGGGARSRSRFSDTVSGGVRCAGRAPLIFAGHISTGDGRSEHLASLQSSLSCSLVGAGGPNNERRVHTHTRKWNPDRVRREENVSRVPPWGKGDARGKNKKVRTAGTIVPAFLWRAAGDAAAMARPMHQGMKPLVPRRILARGTESPNQSATPRVQRSG